jgi:iron complex outermembrane receptor protein
MLRSTLRATLIAFICLPPAVSAQADPQTTAASDEPKSAQSQHPDPDQAIVVTGIRRHSQDVLGSVSILDTAQLNRNLKPSLGDTLASLPGVAASSFGPTASRPILRGLSGERVRILTDGIGSLDLSSSDPDHAVVINPLTAERIEVLRGPASLLYGSSAIGGVVNVVDTRIPRQTPADGVSGDALLKFGSAATERAANASVNVALGGHFVLHADADYSKYDDLGIGGHVLSQPLREQASASSDPDIRALAKLKNKLPNTAGTLDDAGAGLAYVAGGLDLGVSLSHHDAKYGVPIRYSLDPTVIPERPTIDAHQNRGDARAEIPIGGVLKSINFRGGIASYRHAELEADGEVGSRFYSDGAEGRLELVQAERGGWDGTSGMQYLRQTAKIRGDEKYLPNSVNRQVGLFTLQTVSVGALRAEAGFRVEFARLSAGRDPVLAAEPDGDPRVGVDALVRRFTPVSGSIGVNYDLSNDWRAGFSFSHSERAPSIDELFSKGPHGGSQQFLVGNPDLSLEKSNGAELSLHHLVGPIHVQGSLYYSAFSNFLYQAPTGEIADGLPLYESMQGKARYYGFEVEGDAKLGRMAGIDWGAELTADATRATIRHFGPAPLIPARRIITALTGARGPLDGRIEVETVASQNRTAPNETRTDGYTLVSASLDWHVPVGGSSVTLTLAGENLFDVDARPATSVLKDFAPLAGRDIRLSARFAF